MKHTTFILIEGQQACFKCVNKESEELECTGPESTEYFHEFTFYIAIKASFC